MKIKKGKLYKVFGLLFATSLVAVPIISCSSYNNSNKSDVIDIPSNDLNKPSNGIDNSTQNTPSTVAPSISDATLVDFNTYTSKDTVDGYKQNINDFLDNSDFTSYTGSSKLLEKDVYLFFYNLSKKFNNLVITEPKFENLVINNNVETQPDVSKKQVSTLTQEDTNTENDLTLNKTKVSFKASVQIESKVSQNILLGNQQVHLLNGKNTVSFEVNDQLLKPAIDDYLNTKYLSWQVDNVTFELNGNAWIENGVNFTQNFFSQAFKFAFNNLVNGYTYFDLQKKYENEAFNISQEELTQNVVKTVDDKMNQYLSIADAGNEVLNILKQDIGVDQMLKKLSPILINLLTDTNIIPSAFKPILVEALIGKDNNGEVSEVPLINVIDDNRQLIYDLIKKYLGSLFDIAKPIVDLLKPNLKSDSPEFQQLQGYLKSLPQEIQTIIKNDVLGVDGVQPKSLFNILFDNYGKILDLVGKDNKTVQGIKAILDIILKKDEGTQQYGSIYATILKNEQSKKAFIEAVKKLVNISSSVDTILQQIVVKNTGLTKDNAIAFVTALFDFTNGFFEKNATYNSLENKYKNLTITKNMVQQPSLNKNDKTISFKYVYDLSLKTEVILDISKLKALFSKEAIIELIKQIAQSANVSLPSAVGKTDLDKLILRYLPDQIIFGKNKNGEKASNENHLTFTFSSVNDKVWFNPILNGDHYSSGLSYTYNMNIFYDDPEMINTIVNNFKKDGNLKETLIDFWIGSIKMDLYYNETWKSLLENILLRDFDIKFKGNIILGNNISSLDLYNENQIYSGYEFENRVNEAGIGDEFLKYISPDHSESFKDVVSNISTNNEFNWKDTKEIIKGKKPFLNDQQFNNLKNRIFTLGNLEEYNLFLNPILSFNLPLHMFVHKGELVASAFLDKDIPINIEIQLMVSEVNLYLPFKMYDKTNKTLTSEVYKQVTYFKLNVKNNEQPQK